MGKSHKADGGVWSYSFLLDLGPFCGATDTLCLGLRMTLPMSFKVRVDQLSPVLFCHLPAMFPRVIWLLGPGIEPGLLAPEVSMIPLCQPDPTGYECSTWLGF